MRVPRDPNQRLKSFARELRGRSTDAELRMWSQLRDRRFDAWKFRRQVPIGGYIVDFYCVKARLVIELDGGQHGTAEEEAYDAERTRVLEDLGLRVIRFWDNDVLAKTDMVMREVFRQLNEPSPRPSPGVPGEGEGKA
jgi:very-short-patch-repair endonuclease